MRRTWMAVPILCATLSGTGCTWVRLEPQAELVRARAAGDVSGCERIGRTHTRVKATVGPFARSASKVGQELETLARNEAAGIGGNAVAPLGDVSEGRQEFGIYRCP